MIHHLERISLGQVLSDGNFEGQGLVSAEPLFLHVRCLTCRVEFDASRAAGGPDACCHNPPGRHLPHRAW